CSFFFIFATPCTCATSTPAGSTQRTTDDPRRPPTQTRTRLDQRARRAPRQTTATRPPPPCADPEHSRSRAPDAPAPATPKTHPPHSRSCSLAPPAPSSSAEPTTHPCDPTSTRSTDQAIRPPTTTTTTKTKAHPHQNQTHGTAKSHSTEKKTTTTRSCCSSPPTETTTCRQPQDPTRQMRDATPQKTAPTATTPMIRC
uniref:Uncharacterized protein n=1 Tax=Globisporangium ultimum (strain ATCC 200006 / CBS 805.95 / DAOM BR144) TaxID=431595 RepID=K3WXK3_GLOUD